MGPDTWLAGYEPREGSWWPTWTAWLDAQSGRSGPTATARQGGGWIRAAEDAPGRYVSVK
ncbi:MAG: hypothetical protein ACLQF1_20810 [Methyloceanibacter sp.]|jgi:polyhydroxyalkanoate synthase subunit PhaC